MSKKPPQPKNTITSCRAGSEANDAVNRASNDAEGDAPSAPQLVRMPEGLALTDGTMTLRADFSRLLMRANPAKVHQELLVKAAKIKSVSPDELLVVDATAGLGEDSFLLAAAGFNVVMFERDEVIAALLEDALMRAAEDARLASIVARMTLRKEDSITALNGCAGTSNSVHADTPVTAFTHENNIPENTNADTSPNSKVNTSLDDNTSHLSNSAMEQLSPDIVVLDPMFPARTKSASVKKKFQLIHGLEAPCADEQELLDAAEHAHPRKIVIKRPSKGPWLAGRKPAYSLEGKAIRYDCLVFAR